MHFVQLTHKKWKINKWGKKLTCGQLCDVCDVTENMSVCIYQTHRIHSTHSPADVDCGVDNNVGSPKTN